MKQEGVDKRKRRFLTGATSVVGGVGAAFVAVPFLSYWEPSARAEAAGAPVEQDISKLKHGQLISIEWRGKPIALFRRDEKELETLPTLNDELADPHSKTAQQPKYCQNIHRSIKAPIGVLVSICTHLGCSPLYRPERGSVTGSWKGGFYCPCHGSMYDLAGRVMKGMPAPLNLEVPPYWFPKEGLVVIGEHKAEEAAS